MIQTIKKIKITEDIKVDKFISDKLDKLHNWTKLPLGVGIITSLVYLYIYGFHDYLKNFLQWIIGTTMVIIVLEYLTRGKNGN